MTEKYDWIFEELSSLIQLFFPSYDCCHKLCLFFLKLCNKNIYYNRISKESISSHKIYSLKMQSFKNTNKIFNWLATHWTFHFIILFNNQWALIAWWLMTTRIEYSIYLVCAANYTKLIIFNHSMRNIQNDL